MRSIFCSRKKRQICCSCIPPSVAAIIGPVKRACPKRANVPAPAATAPAGALAVQPWATWAIAVVATVGVIIRPFSWPEAVWAVAGAAMLVLFHLLSIQDALAGAVKGTDVYQFLIGMMLLAELARQEGLFDWVAARMAGGSPNRLFALVFGVGTIVTIFLSKDATAVVLTPAVAGAAKAAKAKEPLPYLPTPRASCCRPPIRRIW